MIWTKTYKIAAQLQYAPFLCPLIRHQNTSTFLKLILLVKFLPNIQSADNLLVLLWTLPITVRHNLGRTKSNSEDCFCVGFGGLDIPGVGELGVASPVGSRGNAVCKGPASSQDSLGLPTDYRRTLIDQDTSSQRMAVLKSAVVMQVLNLLCVAIAVPRSGGGHLSSHS